jgi:hypothetical protein
MASRALTVPLSLTPPWYTVFDTCLEDLENIGGQIERLYKKLVPSIAELDERIEKAINARRT